MASLDELTWPRRTARLELHRMTPDDAEAVFAVVCDPTLTEWTSRRHMCRDDFDRDLPNRCTTDLLATWDGRLAGLLAVRITDAWAQADVAEQAHHCQADLGWTVLGWAQGRGIATELAAEGLAIAFQLGVRRVEASCFAANVASWRVMEKVGMRREVHSIQGSLHHSGEWMDGLGYAMLADEWRAGVGRHG